MLMGSPCRRGTYTCLYVVVPSRLYTLSHIGFRSFCHDGIPLCSYAPSFIHIPGACGWFAFGFIHPASVFARHSLSYTLRGLFVCTPGHSYTRANPCDSFRRPRGLCTMNEPWRFICKPCGPSPRQCMPYELPQLRVSVLVCV